MGKYDDAMYSFLSDNERFADLFNGAVFKGKKVLRAAELEDAAERYVLETSGRNTAFKAVSGTQNRYRDIKKRLKSGAGFVVMAIENQSRVDFKMPWRMMQYDWLEYDKQIRQIESFKKQRIIEEKGKCSRFEAEVGEEDRLHPIYTLCLYHGTEEWSGPRSLEDMMDFGGDEELQRALFQNYRMTLVCVEDLKELSGFRTDLKLLLKTLAVRGDREAMKELFGQEEFTSIAMETARTIAVMTDNMNLLEKLEIGDEKKEVNMCQAWEEIREDWENRGREQGMKQGVRQGRKEGRKEGIQVLVLDNLEEGKSEEVIIGKLIRRFGLEPGQAKAYYDKYAVSMCSES